MNEKYLRAKMIERGLTTEQMSDVLGINRATLSRKMSGASDFKRAEIQQISMILQLNNNDMCRIFFAD